MAIRNFEEYFPQQLGVRYDPPAIIIQYVLVEQQKRMHHKILVPTLELESQIIASMIRKEHQDYFYKDRITDSNIRMLIEKLKRGKDRNAKEKEKDRKRMDEERGRGYERRREQDRQDYRVENDKYPKQYDSRRDNEEQILHKPVVQPNNQKPQQPNHQPKQKSEVSDDYYEEQFEDFEASQESKSKSFSRSRDYREESFQSAKSAQKPKDTPFEFFDEDVTEVAEQPKFTKPSKPRVPDNKPAATVEKVKVPPKPEKEAKKEPPKPKKKEEAVQQPVQPTLDDCFQFL